MALDYTDFKNCPVGKYHEFKVLSTPYVKRIETPKQREECKYCHLKVEYSFNDQGQMTEPHRYFLDHIRAFAQPTMACYYEIHPKATLMFETEAKQKEKSENFQQEMSDRFVHEIKDIFG